MKRDKLQVIIDTLESSGGVDSIVEYFDKQVAYHKEQVRRAQVAIDQHQATLDRHTEHLNENQALADAFRTLKGE